MWPPHPLGTGGLQDTIAAANYTAATGKASEMHGKEVQAQCADIAAMVGISTLPAQLLQQTRQVLQHFKRQPYSART